MANERETDIQIVVSAITDEASAEKAAKKLTSRVLSSLKDGCVEIPTALKDPFKGSKTTDELTKAQRAFLSDWEKIASKGFSASSEELDRFVDKFLEFKRRINKENKASSKQNRALKELGISDLIQSYVKEKRAIDSKLAELNLGKSIKVKTQNKSRKNDILQQQTQTQRKENKYSGLKSITGPMNVRTSKFSGATVSDLIASDRGGGYKSPWMSQTAISKKEADKENAKTFKKYFTDLSSIQTLIEKSRQVSERERNNIITTGLMKTLKDTQRQLIKGDKTATPEKLIEAASAAISHLIETSPLEDKDIAKDRAVSRVVSSLLSTYHNTFGRLGLTDGTPKGAGANAEEAEATMNSIIKGIDVLYPKANKVNKAVAKIADLTKDIQKSGSIVKDELQRLVNTDLAKTLTTSITSKVKGPASGNVADIKQVGKTAEKILTQNKVEAVSERVSDTNQETDIRASKDVQMATNEVISMDADTGMNTETNAKALIKASQASNRIDDKNRATLKSILSAIKGPTSDENSENEVKEPKAKSSKKTTQLSILKTISANIASILKLLGGEANVEEDNVIPPDEEQKQIKEESNLPDLYRYIEDGIMKTAEAVTHAVIPEGVKTIQDITKPKDVRQRRAESDIEYERELIEQGKHPTQQRTSKTSVSGYIDNSLSGWFKKAFTNLGFTTNVDKVMAMSQSEIEKLRAQRIDTFGLAESDRNATAQSDRVRAHRVKSIYGWGNKGRDPFENLQLSEGIGIDAKGITEALQNVIEKNMFEAETGGWFKNLIGPLTAYAGQPSLEKTRAQADALNQILANIREATLKLLEGIRAAETDLKGMERTGKAKFDATGNLISTESSKDAIDRFATMEDYKIALRGVLAEAKMVDVVSAHWRKKYEKCI